MYACTYSHHVSASFPNGTLAPVCNTWQAMESAAKVAERGNSAGSHRRSYWLYKLHVNYDCEVWSGLTAATLHAPGTHCLGTYQALQRAPPM
jgi:hypothetical protein